MMRCRQRILLVAFEGLSAAARRELPRISRQRDGSADASVTSPAPAEVVLTVLEPGG